MAERESRPTKRLPYENGQLRRCSVKKKPKTDRNIYEVEVVEVERERKQIKFIQIHSFILLNLETNLTSGVIVAWVMNSYHLLTLNKYIIPTKKHRRTGGKCLTVIYIELLRESWFSARQKTLRSD